jgi:RNA polymerase sigma factor (sigma-70 family)
MADPGDSDEALMARYARGDAASFEVLYRRHEMRVWRYLERNVGNRATADELMQEVWFAVARDAPRYQASAKFTTWLFTIAHNRMIDAIRARRHPVSLDALGIEADSVIEHLTTDEADEPLAAADGSQKSIAADARGKPSAARAAGVVPVAGRRRSQRRRNRGPHRQHVRDGQEPSALRALETARAAAGVRMNDQPPSNGDRDDIDDQYRRAAQSDRGRPSDAVRRAIFEHAAARAAEHAAARVTTTSATQAPTRRNPRTPARWRYRWPLAVVGTLAAACIAGLLVTPDFRWLLTAPRASLTPVAQAPAARAPIETAAEQSPAYAPPAAALRSESRMRAGATHALADVNAGTASQAARQNAGAAARPRESASSASVLDRAAAVRPEAPLAAPAPSQLIGSISNPELTPLLDASALRLAAAAGDAPRMRAILEHPVDIDALDVQGRTALMLATLNGQRSAVETLLAHGANPQIADAQGRTPLDVARAANQREISDALPSRANRAARARRTPSTCRSGRCRRRSDRRSRPANPSRAARQAPAPSSSCPRSGTAP